MNPYRGERVKHNLHVLAIPESVLRSEDNSAILDVVNKALVVVVVQVDRAVIDVVEIEWKTLDLAGLFEQEFVLLVHEHVVRAIDLGLVLKAVLVSSCSLVTSSL